MLAKAYIYHLIILINIQYIENNTVPDTHPKAV